MFWRLRLREAQVAANSGRYDDASRVLADESLREFLPAKRLARDVAGKIAERARDRFALGDTAAGWKDLLTADRLGGQMETVNQIRHNYADTALADVRKYLAAGESASALARLEKLHKRGLADESVRNLTQIAQLMLEKCALSPSAAADALRTQLATQGIAVSRVPALTGTDFEAWLSRLFMTVPSSHVLHAAVTLSDGGT